MIRRFEEFLLMPSTFLKLRSGRETSVSSSIRSSELSYLKRKKFSQKRTLVSSLLQTKRMSSRGGDIFLRDMIMASCFPFRWTMQDSTMFNVGSHYRCSTGSVV